ncbi:serine protease [Pseudorhodobacter ferrugineus]|uniref:serine protease n=1 Tax=Pseudorhodobacter ferrugineus TaxID=77008 RepID=UPI0003B67447|nr:serine protease [Pseudorhodobacter ferrugineus]
MRHFLALFALVITCLNGGIAAAQDRAWVQIEAQPTLTKAEERARAYAAAFGDVAGFQMGSGWYAIALGPYDPDAAIARLRELRRDNLIPRDSFIASGDQFRTAFWPVGQDPAPASLNAAPVIAAPVIAEPGAAVPETVTTEALTPAPDAVAPDTSTSAAVTAPDAGPATPPEAPATETVVVIEPQAETLAESQRAEAALSREERQDLQSALQWFGFYDAAIDGAFGRGTRASMAAWQEANGFEATGVMTTAQRAQIITTRATIIAELGLETVVEEEAGIEVTLPLAMVAFDNYEPPFVHFAEKDGSGLRVILISEPGDRATLRGLYDILQTLEVVPSAGDRSLTDRGFTINAANDAIASHAFAELSGGLIKGYMLVWTPAAADKAGRALAAMQASFKTIGGRALDPGLVSLDDAQRRSLLAGMEVRKPRLSRSGFFVSDTGAVLTTVEALQSCGRITIDRDIEAKITAQDAATGLALLTPTKPLAPHHVAAFEAGALRIGTEVALAGYSYEDALPSPTLTYGAVEDTKGLADEVGVARLSLASLPGDAGGPVVDGTGAVLGMLMPAAAIGSRVLPAEVSFAADATSILAMLTAAGVAPQTAVRQGALPPEDLTDLATSLTVLVSCWE